MSAVATAIVGSAVVTGYMGSKAAGKAAKASAKGADAAAQVQWDMYDQSREDQMPWLGTGANALRQLAALTGVQYSGTDPSIKSGEQSRENFDADAYLAANPDIANPKLWRSQDPFLHWQMYGNQEGRPFTYINPPSDGTTDTSAASAPDYSAFYDSPDYKFALEEGNRSVNAGLAARGLSGSGRAMKELTRYGQGMASQQLNTYRNALAAMAGVGQTTATNLGSLGSQTASNVGNAMQSSADARASGYLGKANAWNSAIEGATGLGAYGKTNKWWG